MGGLTVEHPDRPVHPGILVREDQAQDVHGVADGRHGIAQLVAQDREKLVLAPAGL